MDSPSNVPSFGLVNKLNAEHNSLLPSQQPNLDGESSNKHWLPLLTSSHKSNSSPNLNANREEPTLESLSATKNQRDSDLKTDITCENHQHYNQTCIKNYEIFDVLEESYVFNGEKDGFKQQQQQHCLAASSDLLDSHIYKDEATNSAKPCPQNVPTHCQNKYSKSNNKRLKSAFSPVGDTFKVSCASAAAIGAALDSGNNDKSDTAEQQRGRQRSQERQLLGEGTVTSERNYCLLDVVLPFGRQEDMLSNSRTDNSDIAVVTDTGINNINTNDEDIELTDSVRASGSHVNIAVDGDIQRQRNQRPTPPSALPNRQYKRTDFGDYYPDGGWGWIVCIGAAIVHFLIYGIHYAGGSMYVVVGKQFTEDKVGLKGRYNKRYYY